MAHKRKSAAQSAANFQSGVQRGPAKYIAGVNDPQVQWAASATTTAAIARRNAGLQAAIANKSIEDGIIRAGDAKWRANTAAKGGASWQPQALAATSRYQASMSTVEGDWAGAQQAMDQAGDGSTVESRFARATAFSMYMHKAAMARKGSV